jgi:large subunit ribosomal protein L24
MLDIRKGDQVVVTAGKDKGQQGKVLRVLTAKSRVVVEGVNIVKRHTKPTTKSPQGGIVDKNAALHVSNVMIYCPKCSAGSRIGKQFVGASGEKFDKREAAVASLGGEGKPGKIRVCKRCGEGLD